MTDRYRIELEKQLDVDWSSWLGNLVITHSPEGRTILVGDLPDQAALHGLFCRIRDLGVPIQSVLRISDAENVKIQGETK